MTDLVGFKATDVLRRDAELMLSRGRGGDGAAVLVLAPTSGRPSPAAMERLKREFALRDELSPEWAARPLALDQTAGRLSLILDDPGGEPLDRLIAGRAAATRPAEMSRRLKIAAATASALAEVHDRGIIHKDLNPTTILVDGTTGEIHLTGFGVASQAPREQQQAVPIEVIVGTLAYMAPEQTGRMNRSVDSRSDLYSLGVTCYELFTGQLPFTAADPMEWVHCHIARQPVRPSERGQGIPGQISDIIMKLLAKTAEDRYQTAAGVAADFQRCLAEWEASGRIEPFALASHDQSGRLMIPEKLYGREGESQTLLDAFGRVGDGGMPELVLVSGYSGVGKSALVNQIHAAMVRRGGLYGAGKFDQHRRNIPYATFAQAFHALVRQILSASEQDVSRWRAEILGAVGPNGRLVTDLIPQLEHIIGEQPAVVELPPNEAHIRFLSVFTRFVSVLARPEAPLVLFLDDLQWMDAGGMKLLEHLMTNPEVRHLLLIGSYRDNEVDSSHPLMLAVETIRASGGAVCDIVLSPLSRDDLGQFVADTLRCRVAEAGELVDLVHAKTAGNPFFAIQFLTALVDERLLAFDAASGDWRWDIDKIRAKGFSDNVVELMAAKLRRLPEASQAELQRIACLGNGTTLATLGLVYDRAADRPSAEVESAIRLGFLVRSGDRVIFAHDRIQEAAYLSLPEAAREAAHLHIGRRLIERLPPAAVEEQIFDLVHHLNLASRLIDGRDERARLCHLNVVAGKKAKASSAHASARILFLQARTLLADDAWEQAHDDTFRLFVELSECEYLVGNHDQAGDLFALLLDRARSVDQRAAVWRLRFRMYMVAGRFGDAVAIAVEALRQFGLKCPDSETEAATAVEAARRDFVALLGGRRIAELIDLPDCADASVRALVGVIADAIPAVYHVRPMLYPFLGLSAINLSLRHGVTEDSCAAFSGYSVSLVGRFEDFSTGFEFSELTLRLGERFSSTQLRGTLLFRHGYFVSPWRRPIAACMPILDDCFRACLETGNLIYAAYVAYASAWMLLEKGEPLDVVLATLRKYAPFARNGRIVFATLMIRLQELFVTELQGTTAENGAATDSEDSLFSAMVATAHGYGIAFYHVVKQVTPTLMGRHEEALAAATKAASMLAKISSSTIESSHHFYSALAMTALYPAADPARRREFAPALAEHRRKLRQWADNCPETFASRSLLVEAETARIEGRDNDAMHLYEDAITSARNNGHLHCEGIASERAAGFYLDRGLRGVAENYLRDARYAFLRWGAMAKVGQLDQLYPRLAEAAAAVATAAGFSGNIAGLDLMTVVKAQQAVSGEIVLGKLVESLLRIVVEHAGANRGLLILRHGGGYRIEAEAITHGDAIAVTSCATSPTSDDLPPTVFQYVVRTRDRVVLDDASGANSFATEGYARRTGVKSILCFPVVTHGELKAVLYLENRLAAGAFTRNRVAVLDLLASQASISLENATLYAEMEERVRDRTQELAESLETVRVKSEQVSALLDNSGEGFLSFGPDLIVASEFSLACLDFFGTSPAGRAIDTLLFPDDENARDTMRACIAEALAEPDPHRRELYLSLLPEEISIGQRTLEAEFKVLDRAIMLVLADITEEKSLAEQVAREQHRLEMIVTAVTAGNDFFDVIAEFRAFVAEGNDGGKTWERANLYRTVHTFKGTFNQFGFHDLPSALHRIEAALQGLPAGATGADAAARVFAEDWEALLESELATVTKALGDDFMSRRGVVIVTPEQAERFERFARGQIDEADVPKILEEIASIRTVSLRHALGEFDKLIRQVAGRVEKEVAPLVIEGEDARINPDVFGPFLRTLGHVFRNAVDHGIEDPDSRLAAGKSEVGAITCGISKSQGALFIQIADDGGGIDVETLRRRAAERISADVDDWDIADLIFADGVSVRGEVSELSGRGVGMAAVRAAVEDLGGSVVVTTRAGHGTSFTFRVPFPGRWETAA